MFIWCCNKRKRWSVHAWSVLCLNWAWGTTVICHAPKNVVIKLTEFETVYCDYWMGALQMFRNVYNGKQLRLKDWSWESISLSKKKKRNRHVCYLSTMRTKQKLLLIVIVSINDFSPPKTFRLQMFGNFGASNETDPS